MFLQVALEGKMAIDKMITAVTDSREIRESTIEGVVTDSLETILERVRAKHGAEYAWHSKHIAEITYVSDLKEWLTEALDGYLRVRYSVTKL